MIIQIKEFKFDRFIIPNCILEEGKMIRFWVQVLPYKDHEKTAFFRMKEFQQYLNGNKMNSNIRILDKMVVCKTETKNKWYKFFSNKTVFDYLKDTFHLDSNTIINKLDFFDIKPDYKLKKLGWGHQRMFSIICEFQKEKNIIFDYYGLSPNTEYQLTKYVRSELKRGKSAIGFDNLEFKINIPEYSNLKNVIIWREDEIGNLEQRIKPNFKIS